MKDRPFRLKLMCDNMIGAFLPGEWEVVGEPGISAGQATSVPLRAGNAAYYVAFSDSANPGAVTVLRYR